jgi:hypothetical protein
VSESVRAIAVHGSTYACTCARAVYIQAFLLYMPMVGATQLFAPSKEIDEPSSDASHTKETLKEK